jgi:hypothetical protein
MRAQITPAKLEMLHSFEKYISKGGSVLSFPDYYLSTNNCGELKPEKQVILLALCEELAMLGDYERIFLVLNTIFSFERWSLKSFKSFMGCVENSEFLQPLYSGIFNLHENCKNYIKSM